ncbi:MAG: hypothetical protein R3F56_02420 [Planctomycetota bacterium]
MSKRSKDLFHLLEQREREVREVGETSSSRRPPARTPGTVADRLRQWLGTATPPQGRGRRAPASAPPAVPYGLVLAAVALLCLGTGFALGRFLPRGPDAATLNAQNTNAQNTNARNDERLRPGPVAPASQNPATGPVGDELSAEKEEEVLSNRFYYLLSSPARSEAAQVASYLRAHGVGTARIRKFDEKGGVWTVFAYANEESPGPRLYEAIKAVPPPRTWPTLSLTIGRLKPELMSITNPKK